MNRFALLFSLLLLVSSGCGSSGGSSDVVGSDAVSDGSLTDIPAGDSLEDLSGSDQLADVIEEDGVGPDGTVEDLKDVTVPDSETDVPIQPDVPVEIEPDVPPVDELIIEIVEPVADSTVQGSIRVRIVPVGIDELPLDNISVYVNDVYAFNDKKLPTEFVLDTTSRTGSELKITANAYLADMTATDTVTVPMDNPDFDIAKVYSRTPFYKNGDTVYLYVTTGKTGMELTADFSAMDSGFEPGDENVQETLQGQYLLTYVLSTTNTQTDGYYTIPITASDGSFEWSYSGLQLVLRNSPLLPVKLKGGIFVPGTLPDSTIGWTQPISLIYGNEFIITGGSAKVNVDFGGYESPEEIVGILVGLDGYYGYYQIPIENSAGEEELLMLLRAYIDPETPPSSMAVKIAVRDARGRISPYRTHNLAVQDVGSGDVQVSISWDADDDVDLHVIDPFGCEMYYGHKNCNPGWLDLDSNPGCSIDGINNENVFWPEGQAPTGTFVVRVDFYSDCSGDGPNYTVTLHYCGDIETIEGHFAPGTDDGGGAGSGVTVAQFSNENCGRILRGTIRFQDETFDETGFTATTWKPVRYAMVEVHRLADAQLLSTGYTDRWGNYEIQFNNKEEPGIYLVVKTVTNLEEGLRDITVMNHPKFKQIYSVTSPSIDETEDEFPVLDFDIPEIVGAGAFNILDVVEDGYDLIRRMTGKELGELHVYWATGADTTETLFCSEYFYNQGICSEMMALSVQGKDTDRDEYDDMVILKEFFKYALARTAKDDNPGGVHFGTRDDPRRSWTEGVSTFFACSTLNSRYFVNSRPMGVYEVYDLEAMESPFAFGTKTGTMSGPVSEYLVSAVLWDLFDGAGAESFDIVDSMAVAVFDSIFSYFSSQDYLGRGFDGVDLVDFLDGWFCRNWGHLTDLETLMESRQFNYDFAGPAVCE